MAISTENDVMDTLQTTLASITVANGFQTEVAEVKETVAFLADVENKPGIRFRIQDSERVNIYFGSSERTLNILIWGYVESQALDWDNIRKLKADVEKALSTEGNWSYREDTEIEGDVNYFGDPETMIAIFEIVMKVKYRYAFASP